MILKISDVIPLKNEAREKFSAEVHFHDCCGGQFFSLDTQSEELKNFIALYFAEKNLRAVFSDDGLQFHVEHY